MIYFAALQAALALINTAGYINADNRDEKIYYFIMIIANALLCAFFIEG